MLECNACLLRCLRAVVSDTLSATRPRPHRLLLTPHLSHPRRASSSSAAVANLEGTRYLNAAQIRHHQTKDNDAVALVQHDRTTSHHAKKAERALKKELLYLSDPLKLAEHIHYTLRCDNPDKALELVRLASREMSCIVSWNHIVDWHMQNRRPADAMRIYNEMKKRAQFPDSYTYTMLLRGLAGVSNHHRLADVKDDHATRAVALYTSMLAPGSRVKPSIIHTNAALRVCSFAFDLDAFWSIAGHIPADGPGSADHITYSIILHAIRHDVLSKQPSPDSGGPADMSGKKRAAVDQARKIWEEIIQKCRAGTIKLDEELVCAMARVLLLSDRLQEWDDVLSLIQQTMQIERLVPALGSPDRQTGHIPLPTPIEPLPALTPSEQAATDTVSDTPNAKLFHPLSGPVPIVTTRSPQPHKPLTYVNPGTDTLSILLAACTLLRLPATATAYWTALTSAPFHLRPDLDNFHALLRLLGKNRASGKAAALLRDELPRSGVRPKNMTFRMAMGVCTRDNKNARVVENAGCVVEAMGKADASVDVQTLVLFLNLVTGTPAGRDGKTLLRALEQVEGVGEWSSSASVDGSKEDGEAGEDREKLQLHRQMVGAIDTLLTTYQGAVADPEAVGLWQSRRAKHARQAGSARTLGESNRRLLGRRRMGGLPDNDEGAAARGVAGQRRRGGLERRVEGGRETRAGWARERAIVETGGVGFPERRRQEQEEDGWVEQRERERERNPVVRTGEGGVRRKAKRAVPGREQGEQKKGEGLDGERGRDGESDRSGRAEQRTRQGSRADEQNTWAGQWTMGVGIPKQRALGGGDRRSSSGSGFADSPAELGM